MGRQRRFGFLRSWWWLALVPAIPVFVALWVAASVWISAGRSSHRSSDAAIVLGAAVWTDEPSPVFRERINHAVDLYRQGAVRKIIFTGGLAEGDTLSEAEAAERYALGKGVPAEDILLETSSTATLGNLRCAKPVAEEHGLTTFLIVSDPLHMRRAMRMAADQGLDARPNADDPLPELVELDGIPGSGGLPQSDLHRHQAAEKNLAARCPGISSHPVVFPGSDIAAHDFPTEDRGAPSPQGGRQSPGSS